MTHPTATPTTPVPDALTGDIPRTAVEQTLGSSLTDLQWAAFVSEFQGRLDNNLDELLGAFCQDWAERGTST